MGLLGDIIDIVFDSDNDNDSYQEFNTQQCTCPKCGCLNATILLNDYGFKFCCPECLERIKRFTSESLNQILMPSVEQICETAAETKTRAPVSCAGSFGSVP